ncbi:MAG: hypothetical protein JWR19_2082 [Pedosphaera sp.]|nr:hypothetical protein [Pedosphaera sp.]
MTMNDTTENAFEKAAAFQKIWMDTFTRMAQSGFSLSPDSTPPEFLRQMRSGIFHALSKSWEEFMRSPQFTESMKGMMDNAIAFRKMSNDFLTGAHHTFQGTARADIDSLMLALRHLETRILDRVEDISTRLDQLEQRLDGAPRNGKASAHGKNVPPQRKRKTAARRTKATGKQS